MIRHSLIPAAIACASMGVSNAQVALDDPEATITVLVENDAIIREDDNFSSGNAFSYMSGTRPLSGFTAFLAEHVVRPKPGENTVSRRGFSLNHLIYTPDDLRSSEPLPDQHPYAGVFFIDGKWAVQQERRLDVFTVEVGMIGPATLAESIQTELHEYTGATVPQGWDNQIKDEALFNVHYDVQKRVKRWNDRPRPVDLVLTGSASAGNRYTGIAGGAKLRWGSGVDQSFGPIRIRPALTGSAFFTPDRPWSWYVFAGGELRAVPHSIVLDNSLFRDGDVPSVDSKTFVSDFQIGGVLQWGRTQASLTMIARSPQFETEEDDQTFGAISVARKF